MHRNCASDLLQFAMSDELVRDVLIDGLSRCGGISARRFLGNGSGNQVLFAVPKEWNLESVSMGCRDKTDNRSVYPSEAKLIHYEDNVPLDSEAINTDKGSEIPDSWFVVSNGRYATNFDSRLHEKVLTGTGVDVLAVNIEPDLLGERERVRLTTDGKVAGFRRVYSDSAEFVFVGQDWPDHLFIRSSVLGQILCDGTLPLSFSDITEKCRLKSLMLRAINIGGGIIDLETEEGLLGFCRLKLSDKSYCHQKNSQSLNIAADARIVGNVLVGRNVTIGAKAAVIGPVIIGNNVNIEPGVVIHSSIVASTTSLRTNQFFQNCILRNSQNDNKGFAESGDDKGGRSACPRYDLDQWYRGHGSFRRWPALAYARCLKRITDIIAATIVLLLFAPLMPFVALAIKLTSPGPVFYRDSRQGLHGKEFDCLKFRTMIPGAHAIQEKLRIVSQVDGPQFKMDDDPRISTVGRFLRETYIDEIPQFFNVLFGQMSVVGPRPSPVTENTLCPIWRDGRLSVRPGITGLWQLYRTRQPMRDFQEWIYYDLEYVRNLSLWMDLRVCWQTTKKLLDNFISQF